MYGGYGLERQSHLVVRVGIATSTTNVFESSTVESLVKPNTFITKVSSNIVITSNAIDGKNTISFVLWISLSCSLKLKIAGSMEPHMHSISELATQSVHVWKVRLTRETVVSDPL